MVRCVFQQASYYVLCQMSTGATFSAKSDLNIRLANTKSNKTGRLEIFHPSFGWGTVCDDEWDDTDSRVVCRQLGFSGVNATGKKAYGGQGTGSILFDDVKCTGDESFIWDCSHRGWNVHNCDHSKDVGVDCT
ncbi:Deleted in malignant brain tumors 1, partial [Paramuricea clavata]